MRHTSSLENRKTICCHASLICYKTKILPNNNKIKCVIRNLILKSYTGFAFIETMFTGSYNSVINNSVNLRSLKV